MKDLSTLVIEAHIAAAHRDNASTQVLKGAYASNGGDAIKAIAAALMTLGGAHAPIKQTYNMLEKIAFRFNNETDYVNLLEQFYPGKIPGFGSAFVKEKPDPLLKPLDDWFQENKEIVPSFKQLAKFHNTAQGLLSERFRLKHDRSPVFKLYPNLAFYTAASAIIMGDSIYDCERMMIKGRVMCWTDLLVGEAIISFDPHRSW